MPEVWEEDVTTLLTAERQAILLGDFEAVLALSVAKENLISQIETSKLPANDLARHLGRLQDNQTLLAAAMKGIASAQTRLKELTNVRDGLTVYHHNGRTDRIANCRPAFERKA
ncbi:hypothetical protein [Yoonia sp. 208BN28-4]|uniref:hypothetical protein n=1 Tax=Yoonia sp. 208BN28-4 TaxID=3126505 RepID=UPI00309AA1EB